MGEARGPLTGRSALAWEESGGDAAVIERSIGEPGYFAIVFDRHAPAIYRFIARRLGGDVADDLVSEVFLIAFQRREGYDQAQADARPWLYGIATNLISRRRREEVRFLRAIARTAISLPIESVDDQVAERVDAQAVSRQLAAALATLPGLHRDTVMLIASGLSHHEAALALGVPAGTVASRLARARPKLRAALGGQNPAQTREE